MSKELLAHYQEKVTVAEKALYSIIGIDTLAKDITCKPKASRLKELRKDSI